MRRNIITFDEAALRRPCLAVREADDRARRLLDDLKETMYASKNGGGLAANQIGVFKRAFVMDMGEGYHEFLNPEIVRAEGVQEVTEGCLSFPGVWAKLKRPQLVVVHALDREGNRFEFEGTGDVAKCLCHEIGHLDGAIFLDSAEKIWKG